MLALLEVALTAAVVVWSFAGHRDAQLGQPRELSDWAFSRGYDPLLLILGIGLVTMGGLALLLLHGQKLVKTVGTVAVLLLLCAGAGLWLLRIPAWLSPPTFRMKKPAAAVTAAGRVPKRSRSLRSRSQLSC